MPPSQMTETCDIHSLPFPCAACLSAESKLDRGESRFAARLAARRGRSIRYIHGVGWFTWDGMRWARDDDGTARRELVSLKMETYAEIESGLLDKDDAKLLNKDVRCLHSAGGTEGTLKLAQNLKPIAAAQKEVDADKNLFNTLTGTVDLVTGDQREHRREDLITKISGCGVGKVEDGTRFQQFLVEVLPDPSVRSFVKRLIGYSMLGQVKEHVLPIFTGDGANGKTTLLEAVSSAFGDYAISAEPGLLLARKNEAHPTGQADLLGVRFALTTETGKSHRLDAATVKRLTGGDTIRARRMRQDFMEFEPSHTIFMLTNHPPSADGDDSALWRRILVVPFDVVIPEDQRDPNLKDTLALELPAILAWALEGYREYQTEGLSAPESVRLRTEKYREIGDPLGRFLEERTVPEGNIQARVLYNEWKLWCDVNGEHPGRESAFSTAMEGRGHQKIHRSDGQVYKGVSLGASSVEPEAAEISHDRYEPRQSALDD